VSIVPFSGLKYTLITGKKCSENATYPQLYQLHIVTPEISCKPL